MKRIISVWTVACLFISCSSNPEETEKEVGLKEPPKLVSVVPAHRSVDIPVNTVIQVIFNKSVKISGAAQITVNEKDCSGYVDDKCLNIVFTLKKGMTYDVFIKKPSITDFEGNTAEDISFSFSTEKIVSGFDAAVNKYGALKVNGIQLVDAKNNPVTLRGVSFGWHNWWPRFYNAHAVNWLATDWDCAVVRAAMGVDPDKGYLDDPQGSEKLVCDVVDAAINNGIYVIIDWHCHNIRLEGAIVFFSKMAEKYGKYPNVIYEIFNEPEQQSWEDVKAYSHELIKTIRAIDPDNIILVGSPHWNQDVDIAAANPISGYSNLMYTLHFYAASHHKYLRDKADIALKKGLPLFVSECAGMEASGNGPINHQQWGEWLNWMENNRVSWVLWSISDKDETCSMLLPSATSDGSWDGSMLREWGKISRREIKQYQNQP